MAQTAKQKAATKALVALNKARAKGTALATRTRSAVTRYAQPAVTIVQQGRDRAAPSGTRRRKALDIAGKGGGYLAMAQVRILPAAIGGYMAAKVERTQRKATAQMAQGVKGASKPIIADPTNRLLAELALLAVISSKTTGIVREAACGAAGGVGAMMEMYRSNDGLNPVDDYQNVVAKGDDGVTVK